MMAESYYETIRREQQQREASRKIALSTDEARKFSAQGTIKELADYERAADERKSAWEASPFFCSWERLFRRASALPDDRCPDVH